MDREAELGLMERFACEHGITHCPTAFLWVSVQGERQLEPITPLVVGYGRRKNGTIEVAKLGMSKQRRES